MKVLKFLILQEIILVISWNKKENKEEGDNVVIPIGFYDELGLNYFSTRYLNSSLDRYPISMSTNLEKIKFVIILKENYKFRFKSDLCFILGFENEPELSSTYNEVTKVPNITRNVDKIHIHCSLVDSKIMNWNATFDVISSFSPKTQPGTLL